ncbi:altronate dehydratase [Pseudomaricurvus alcaniphilus]|uniref:UxaA family hydrolase n=1 Tax=Pseudomaricurvus alcaniphilus TaxID=1166482 RepID=UPI00140CA62F|nr:altronate dehydratase family protein [Pseudomaricurvus alcaniphilus]NHN36806.1 altronate dehydratase [Pseudomaricurvus alcaniphilus]
MKLTLKLHEQDNVALARSELRPGVLLAELDGAEVLDTVPRFHKIAARDIAAGEQVRKYNQVIGVALQPIRKGQHVHAHNCGVPAAELPRSAAPRVSQPQLATAAPQASFQGYRRASGKAGTRNYIGILTSVNCSATVAKQIEQHFAHSDFLQHYANVDGVVAFTHATGCGMGQGEGFAILNRVYKGYANHPNFAGVLMIGLGCEVMQLADFKQREGIAEGQQFRSLIIQSEGGTRKTVAAGIAIVEDMIRAANQLQREPIPASELVVGLQCGGSDALSGITANPSLGAAMDILVQQGGTAILSETPEIYGAEHLLLARAKTPEVGQALLDRLSWWLDYTRKNGVELNNNPSPGNKAGGLTTILEKSLGAQAKGGTSPLNAVYQYAEPVTERGLVIMDSPGYDPVSVTGQMASGANLVCFTTGRGSAYGSKPAPCLKLATNTPLYESMIEDMDFNCGGVFDGEMSVAECGRQIFDELLEIASGKRSKSELLQYGSHEFLPWQIGAVI